MQYMGFYNHNYLAGSRTVIYFVFVVDWAGQSVLYLQVASILEKLPSTNEPLAKLTLSTSMGGKSSSINLASDPSSSSNVLSLD